MDTDSCVVASPIEQLENEFLDILVDLYPVRATLLGIHGGDATLGPSGEEAARRARETWRGFAEALAVLPDSGLSPDDRFDVLLMRHELQRRLFEVDSLRVGETDPRVPLGNLSSGVYGVLARDYAPLPQRAQALVERLNEATAYLDAAADFLGDPPRVLVDQALSRADALSILLRDDVPEATSALADTSLGSDLDAATHRALEAVWRYRERLVEEILPRSTDSFALGETLFAGYLRAAEGIDTPIPELRQKANHEIDRLAAAFRTVSARIDSTSTPAEVMYKISLDYPAEDSMLAFVEDAVREVFAFVSEDPAFPHLDPLPLEVRPTPGVSRWSNASLAAPGPFEDVGFPAIFYVTPVDPLAADSLREEHLRFMSRSLLRNLAVHEASPGHGLHVTAMRELTRPVRRATWSLAFVEGWAHYTESLILERGYRADDDAFRLATLQSGLRRAGRFRVALGLHTEGWTVDEATAFLKEHSFLEPSVARREAERGTVDPLYLVYTLGRMELEALREEVSRLEGDGFDLGRFHRNLLALGSPPLPLVRAMFLAPEALTPRFLD